MKHFLLALLILTLAATSVIFSPSAKAAFDPFGTVCHSSTNATNTTNATVCQDTNRQQQAGGSNALYGPSGILSKAAQLIRVVAGVAAVILVIVAGIKYSLSGGDSKSTESARNTIIYALIGLVIAMAAQGIVVFVINRL